MAENKATIDTSNEHYQLNEFYQSLFPQMTISSINGELLNDLTPEQEAEITDLFEAKILQSGRNRTTFLTYFNSVLSNKKFVDNEIVNVMGSLNKHQGVIRTHYSCAGYGYKNGLNMERDTQLHSPQDTPYFIVEYKRGEHWKDLHEKLSKIWISKLCYRYTHLINFAKGALYQYHCPQRNLTDAEKKALWDKTERMITRR